MDVQTHMNLEWHYNEAHHGKGPMDGIGGTLKNVVYRKVMSGDLVINSPKEFATHADALSHGIKCLYMPMEEVPSEPADITTPPGIAGTLKIHKLVRNESEGHIDFFYLSNASTPFHQRTYTNSCGHRKIHVGENSCGECRIEHTQTEKVDWLSCKICNHWFHEQCF